MSHLLKRVLIGCIALALLGTSTLGAESANLSSLKEQIEKVLPTSQKGKISIAYTNILTGETIGLNDTTSFNPASVIKVAVLVEAYIQASEGRFNFSDTLELKKSHKVPGAGPMYGQLAGKRFTIQHLAECMIHYSDNTATKMLIDFLGKENINRSMKKLGLKNTVIGNSDLLHAQGLNVSTSRDINLLLTKISRGQVVSSEACSQMVMLLSNQKYRWGIPKSVPKNIIVANKTGTLNGIKHDVGIVFDQNTPYAVSIFTQNFDSVSQAKLAIAKVSETIFKWTNDHYHNKSSDPSVRL